MDVLHGQTEVGDGGVDGGVDGGNLALAQVLEKAGFGIAPELSTSDTDIYVRYIK